MLDIRNFGIADPTGAQDSTAALQNAINAAIAIANVPNLAAAVDSTVFIPPGTFLIARQFAVPSQRRLVPVRP